MHTFETTVDGVDCICEVDYYYSGTNFPITSTSEEPNDEPEFAFTLNDHKGKLLIPLTNALTAQDRERILEEFLEFVEDDI